MSAASVTFITSLLIIFASAFFGALTAKRLRQPVVLGYIAAGIIFGSIFPNILDRNFVGLVSDAGLTLLLFTLGIEFSFQRIKNIAGTLLWAVAAQILFTIFIFLGILMAFGISFLTALFLAAAISLSSTALIVKILSEKGELETNPGELATGWLIFQDLAVVPMMVILPAIATSILSKTNGVPGDLVTSLALSIFKTVVFLGVVVLLGRELLPKLLDKVADFGSREILIITTVGIVFLGAVSAYALGLSAALGAFLAGLLVSETSLNHAIFAEVRPLRDLFVVVFFVTLGLLLPVNLLIYKLPLIIFLTLCVVGVKWFVLTGLSRFLGFHRKTSFLVGIYLIPISEFGFVLAKTGLNLGAISTGDYVFSVGLIFASIFVGSPLITNGQAVYYWFYRTLGRFWPKIFAEKVDVISEEKISIRDHIIICGYGRVGKYVGRALSMENIPFIVIDYNHSTVHQLRESGVQVIYGDPADKDVLAYANVGLAKAMIIAIPDRHTQEMIIANTHSLNRRIKIICRTHHEEDQKDLKALGVTTVIQPEFEAALSIVERLLSDFGATIEEISGKISRLKIEHGLG